MRTVLVALVVALGAVAAGGCSSEPTQPQPTGVEAAPKNSGADVSAKKGSRIPAPKAP